MSDSNIPVFGVQEFGNSLLFNCYKCLSYNMFTKIMLIRNVHKQVMRLFQISSIRDYYKDSVAYVGL